MKYLALILLSLLFDQSARAGLDLDHCRNKIPDLLCLVDPLDESNPFADMYSRPCLEGAEKYTGLFQRHFDNSPEVIQRMYCSLDRIWIENTLASTAYAVPIRDHSNTLVAGAIGISRNFLENNPSLSDWMKNKEEASFGHENIFAFHTQSPRNLSAVDYALNHEFGHLFDYANNIQESWLPITWEFLTIPKEEFTFPLRRELCFYQCGNSFASRDKGKDLISSLRSLPFVSSYATVNSKEDWAETFALYSALEFYQLELEVEVENNRFSWNEHLESERLKNKKEFFNKFMNGLIKYPGH